MTPNDQKIAEAMRKNPQQGFKLLMAAYMQPLYWHTRRLVGSHDDAEDATQEALVRIYKSFDQYDAKRSLTAWVFTIATREALRLLARRVGRATVSLDEATAQVLALAAPDQWLDSSDTIAVKLQQAIHTLPAKQQVTFNLRYYDELSYAEIAEVTGSTAAAAKANYHVAKEKITQYMNQHD
jgi:RNA polymerase sigma-70 factor (ECF subfamily)